MPGITSLLNRLPLSRQTPLLSRIVSTIHAKHHTTLINSSSQPQMMLSAGLASSGRCTMSAQLSDRPLRNITSRQSPQLINHCQLLNKSYFGRSVSVRTPPHVRRHSVSVTAVAAGTPEQITFDTAGTSSKAGDEDIQAPNDFLSASTSFDSFGLDPRIVDALREAGFGAPSQVCHSLGCTIRVQGPDRPDDDHMWSGT